MANSTRENVIRIDTTGYSVKSPAKICSIKWLPGTGTPTALLRKGGVFTAAVASTLTDQDITYTAQTAGVAGDSITIELINDAATDVALSINVTGTDIAVTLEKVADAIVTTADELVAAINADQDAYALVMASGSGQSPLIALAQTALSGGADEFASGNKLWESADTNARFEDVEIILNAGAEVEIAGTGSVLYLYLE